MAFDVTKYSYDDLVAEATRLVSEQGGWKDAYQSSTGQVLIQLLAAMTDRLHYMLERRTQENFLETARLPSSVNAIANMLGYRPKRRISAKGTLALNLFDDNGAVSPTDSVIIPIHTKVEFNGVQFLTTEDHIITSASQFPYHISVIEGQLKSATFDPEEAGSTLKDRNYVNLDDFANIEENSLTVTTATQTFNDVSKSVDGEPPLESLSFADETQNAYDVHVTNKGMRIVFGDNTNGRRPVGPVTITWIESNGSEVEILSTGSDFKFDSEKLIDTAVVVPALEYSYTLKNIEALSGGQEAEAMEDIRRNAPDYIRTAGNAVTKHDYAYWTRNSGVGGIVAASAYGESDLKTLFENLNNVYISYLTSDGSQLSDPEKQQLREFLDVYKNATVHTVIEPAPITHAQIVARVKRTPSLTASNSEVYARVHKAMTDYFKYKHDSINKPFFYSGLIDTLLAQTTKIKGVPRQILDFVHMTVKPLNKFQEPMETYSVVVTLGGTSARSITIEHNGVSYTHTSSSGSIDTDLNNLETSILAQHDNITVEKNLTTDTLIISASDNIPFTITNSGSANRLQTRIEFKFTIPVPDLVNAVYRDQIEPNSVEIVDSVGNVLATDDGAGNIYNGTIDYQNGACVLPMQDDGTLFVRYQQNDDNNIYTNIRSVVGLLPPKANYTDLTETLSRIEIID